MGLRDRAEGRVVGLRDMRVTLGGRGFAVVDVDLDRLGSVSFPWVQSEDPRLGDRVLVTMELLREGTA